MNFLELGRQTLASYAEAERVFSVRRNEGGGKDYYIKWRNLPYSEATWEDEFNVTNYYQAGFKNLLKTIFFNRKLQLLVVSNFSNIFENGIFYLKSFMLK